METPSLKKKILDSTFYSRPETLTVAQELLGNRLLTQFEGKVTGGKIVEVEAYLGAEDRACHAYQYLKTKRTEVMYQQGGVAYIYLCYGIHHLLNIVTHREGQPHAILIRSILPEIGVDTMLLRRNKKCVTKDLLNGPGKVSQALGLTLEHNGLSLTSDALWIEMNLSMTKKEIQTTPRIGIDYALEDRFLPYRFVLQEII